MTSCFLLKLLVSNFIWKSLGLWVKGEYTETGGGRKQSILEPGATSPKSALSQQQVQFQRRKWTPEERYILPSSWTYLRQVRAQYTV
jgi:hypothetical protein